MGTFPAQSQGAGTYIPSLPRAGRDKNTRSAYYTNHWEPPLAVLREKWITTIHFFFSSAIQPMGAHIYLQYSKSGTPDNGFLRPALPLIQTRETLAQSLVGVGGSISPLLNRSCTFMFRSCM